MEEEKPFEPTRRKLNEARKKGNLLRSNELASAIVLSGSLLILFSLAFKIHEKLGELLIACFGHLNDSMTLSFDTLLITAFAPFRKWLLLMFFGVLILGVLAYLLQQGWVFIWPKKEKNERSLKWPTLLFCLKLAVLLSIAACFIFSSSHLSLGLSTLEKQNLLFRRIGFVAATVAIFYLIIGLIDYFVQRGNYYRSMRMSKQEIDDERKESVVKRPHR